MHRRKADGTYKLDEITGGIIFDILNNGVVDSPLQNDAGEDIVASVSKELHDVDMIELSPYEKLLQECLTVLTKNHIVKVRVSFDLPFQPSGRPSKMLGCS